MILRKPYAFLIKYFKRINIVLLIGILFLFYKTMRFHQFAKNYLDTTIYNSSIESISSYFNILTVLVFMAVFIICAILIYLLRKKDKPYIAYILIIIVNLFSFGLLVYSNNYFNYEVLKGFRIVSAKTVSDLSFIANLLYYPLIIILLIRSLGIDLKSFGFQEDKEFIEVSEEDREEVELQVGFDKEKWMRKTKFYFRNTKYFIVEHKRALLAVFGVVFLIGFIQFYEYYYVTNRVYNMNQTIKSNNYKLKVRNTYITDKDYNGNVITTDDSVFIVVDLGIKNMLNRDRDFDIEKVLLYIDDAFYVPTTRYNNAFKDMGNLYKGKPIKPGATTSYLLIYQIPKPKKSSNFVLKYQDVGSTKLVRVRIKILDISTFKDKGEQTYPQEFSMKLNDSETMTFRVKDYAVGDSTNYAIQRCQATENCPIYQETYNTPGGKKVMHLVFTLIDTDRDDFINFVYNYGKIVYKIGEEEKEIKVINAVDKKYRGNHLYFLVPDEVANASKVDLVFTIRAYRYTYHLKGE